MTLILSVAFATVLAFIIAGSGLQTEKKRKNDDSDEEDDLFGV